MANKAVGDVRICDENGEQFIAASQRPDGTWRKPRRVKAGYTPQEEVPVYESKGKRFTATPSSGPVGLSGKLAAQSSEIKHVQHSNPSGGTKSALAHNVSKAKMPTAHDAGNKTTLSPLTENQKQIRTLKKKIADISKLEERIQTGELQNPEKNQLDKISKKEELLEELLNLELLELDT